MNVRLLCKIAALLAASPFVAKGQLITPAIEAQLEAWIGQGDLTFTNIFSKPAGILVTSDFHAAVDGKGPTVTLIRAIAGTSNIPDQIIGGYNPVSWSSAGGYTINPTDAGRTAFIFNYTYNSLQRQNLVGQGTAQSGDYQSLNNSNHGPTMGGGWDLYPASNNVYALNYSFGGTSYGNTIFYTGTNFVPTPSNPLGYAQAMMIGLEVYSVASTGITPVPEPGVYGALGAVVLVGLVSLRRIRQSKVFAGKSECPSA